MWLCMCAAESRLKCECSGHTRVSDMYVYSVDKYRMLYLCVQIHLRLAEYTQRLHSCAHVFFWGPTYCARLAPRGCWSGRPAQVLSAVCYMPVSISSAPCFPFFFSPSCGTWKHLLVESARGDSRRPDLFPGRLRADGLGPNATHKVLSRASLPPLPLPLLVICLPRSLSPVLLT